MATPTADPSDVVADALNDFFGQLYTFCETIFGRFFKNLYLSFAEVSVNRWTKVILSVVGYILVRPYIEKLFAHLHDKNHRKEQEKVRAAREAAAANGEAKMSANELRGGRRAADTSSSGGRVLGEVENTDDEIDEQEEDVATASGVPELGKNARKRQKKQMRNLEKDAQGQASTHNLSEEQLMELLDWSESEDEGKKKGVKKDE
ncbi:hypothetical protein N8T08_001184 [Aspergillus melleus]|uniref:Uncharacterized protein n=1 Tax=Aspergillus melleus TaxID=138277 RepID=A0ACC3ANU0_9EURO|nr:hypothetical protein N8T08_001184 [Aspergillus melleus]